MAVTWNMLSCSSALRFTVFWMYSFFQSESHSWPGRLYAWGSEGCMQIKVELLLWAYMTTDDCGWALGSKNLGRVSKYMVMQARRSPSELYVCSWKVQRWVVLQDGKCKTTLSFIRQWKPKYNSNIDHRTLLLCTLAGQCEYLRSNLFLFHSCCCIESELQIYEGSLDKGQLGRQRGSVNFPSQPLFDRHLVDPHSLILAVYMHVYIQGECSTQSEHLRQYVPVPLTVPRCISCLRAKYSIFRYFSFLTVSPYMKCS